MNITYRKMQKEDIEKVTPLFIEYWNGTGDEWTPELVYRRVWQVLGAPDSYCMIAEDGVNTVGFAMGRLETYYDLTAYNLVEIIIASAYQKSGIGTKMMAELEERVKEMGAAMIQLISVNDEMHEHFYETRIWRCNQFEIKIEVSAVIKRHSTAKAYFPVKGEHE